MDKDQLKSFVEANPKLVQRRESTKYPGLFVLKYSRHVFYSGEWNDILEECRGLVVDNDWNIVVHPFTKIYNRGENKTDMDLYDKVIAVTKVNGFMAAVTIVDGEAIISTTGSLDSDFVEYAREILGDIPNTIAKAMSMQNSNFTFIFEICHPCDPHIIEEEHGAYLIGIRDLSGQVIRGPMLDEWKLDSWARTIKAKRPKWAECFFSDVIKFVREVNHEGFIVRRVYDDFTLKIKSPYYLTLKAMARKKDILSLDKTKVDEEFYDLLQDLTLMGESFNLMEEQQRLDYIRSWISKNR